MSTNLTINGTSYAYPATGDQTWGDQASAWAAAVTSGMLQKSGGVFTLTADVNFGANFGIFAKYLTSQATTPATTGVVRLANLDTIKWRNAGNTADLGFYLDASNVFQLGSGLTVTGTVTASNFSGTNTGNVSIGSPANGLSIDAFQVLTLQAATGSVNGALLATDWTTFNSKVTSLSVASANGFAGTVSGTTTPAVTLTTTISGMLKGAGSALIAATAGTDYSAGTASLGTGILKSTTSTGALTIAVAADFPTLNQNTTGSSATSTTATNIAGGAGGSIPYQTAAATTAFLANGSSGQVLTSQGTTLAPTWSSPLTNPMNAAGDIIVGGTAGAATRLGIGSAGQIAQVSGGTVAWVTSALAQNQAFLQNLGLACSVASNALTIALKQNDGSTDPAAIPSDVKIGFRSSTATSGAYNIRSSAAATSIVVPSGATLGQTSAMNQYVWVYAIDNSGTVELAVSGITLFQDNSIQSTTAITSGSTSGAILYSTTARTNVPVRLIGRLTVNETTAGTWASAPTDVITAPKPTPNITDWVQYTPTFVGFGTVTAISFYSKRIGDTLLVHGQFTGGTPTATANSITIGYNGTSANVSIDTTKVLSSSLCGDATQSAAGASLFRNAIIAANQGATTVSVTQQSSTVAATQGSQAGNNLVGTGITLELNFVVPIVGWSTFGA